MQTFWNLNENVVQIGIEYISNEIRKQRSWISVGNKCFELFLCACSFVKLQRFFTREHDSAVTKQG